MCADEGSGKTTADIAGRLAVIVGAAGGIGRAIAARLAGDGCRLALLDRDEAGLTEVGGSSPSFELLTCPVDITDRTDVDRAVAEVLAQMGSPYILVNAAGINTKQRTLSDLSPEQWDSVVAVNLNGAFHCTQAFLPAMREAGAGLVVNIVSAAARLTSAGAGAHYCAAKRALLSLTESTNIEEGANGIRACAICPGEVATPLVDQRPEPPGPERLSAMLRPEDVADAVHYVVTRPSRVTVSELMIFPTSQISGRFVV